MLLWSVGDEIEGGFGDVVMVGLAVRYGGSEMRSKVGFVVRYGELEMRSNYPLVFAIENLSVGGLPVIPKRSKGGATVEHIGFDVSIGNTILKDYAHEIVVNDDDASGHRQEGLKEFDEGLTEMHGGFEIWDEMFATVKPRVILDLQRQAGSDVVMQRRERISRAAGVMQEIRKERWRPAGQLSG
ncbi:hypothetical protein L6452_38705 [Arctium lappa]|uniref:Uncharacterized protein n=1 Tax=Arctium lappa TaxID=4217 RepID=A0ACB8XQU1_ARCLA|nr:hypothetical protein L6452_38705 [Arctium lappa]